MTEESAQPWSTIHEEACASKLETYIDPETGRIVMTRYSLEKRGYCCESGCRHCPYGFNAAKSSG